MESRSLIDYSVFVILDTYVENSNSTAVKMCNDYFFAFGFLQNKYLRPKTQNENCFFLQAYQTRDSQTGSPLFLRHQMMHNQWGLPFLDKAGSNYKTKTPLIS